MFNVPIIVLVVITINSVSILSVHSARILAIEPNSGKSHWNFMSGVLRALTDNGHEVTAFTPYPDGNRENYTEVDVSYSYQLIIDLDFMDLKNLLSSLLKVFNFSIELDRHGCKIMYDNDQLNAILEKDLSTNFDAIIVEPGTTTVCMTYIATKSNLPLIFTIPTSTNAYTQRVTFGDVPNPATVSPIFADHSVPRTFTNRFSNVLSFLYYNLIIIFKESSFKLVDSKPFDLNIPPSLVFINQHFIGDSSRLIPSNAVSVGGVHLKPARKISKDILEFMNGSPHGIILFTLGSTIAISTLPEKIQRTLIETLALLPQRVLLKYEVEIDNIPNNIMIRKWLPQRDILLHPKVKLFISHGGINGLYEAVDAGVPVLGFPVFGDQPRNVDNLVEAGMAISMELLSVSNKNEFFTNIVELINNKTYTENAKIASRIFKDRPMSPEKSVVYWTEYVIRHRGAPHLKSHAINLTWYQYYLLDVIATVLVLVSVFIFITFKCFKYSYKYFLNDTQHLKTKSD